MQNPFSSARSKHIDVRYHFIRELFKSGKITAEYVFPFQVKGITHKTTLSSCTYESRDRGDSSGWWLGALIELLPTNHAHADHLQPYCV